MAPGFAAPDLIVGHGALGRLLARIAIAAGHPAPTVWEINPARMDGAQDYAVVRPDDDPRRDYRAIYDVSGDSSLLDTLVGRLSKGGEIVLAGFYAERLSFDFPPAFMKEARLRTAAEFNPADLDGVNDLLSSGALSLDGLITHHSAPEAAGEAYHTAFADAGGLKMILDLAYTLEIPKLFMHDHALNQKKFWQHSLAVAILSRLLGEHLTQLECDPDPCYLSGLMHDIGVVVFNFAIPREYEEFLRQIRGIDKPLEVLEQKRFGIAHPELGALFIKKWWPIPDNVVMSVEKHFLDLSEKGKKFPVLLTVIMANAIANNYGMGHGISAHKETLDRTFLQGCGLSPELLEELVGKTRESVHMAQEVLYK